MNSPALDRILRSVVAKSAYINDAVEIDTDTPLPQDSESDGSLSFGDWRDSIGTELHALKKSLEEIAVMCDEVEDWILAAKIRAIVKDL